MSKKNPASINLLKNSKNEIFEKFIDWALTIGRLLVIITEIVALSAFIYRFSLDRQLIDLHDKIKQEQAIVSFFKDKERTYRNLQDRLKVASTYYAVGQDKLNTSKDIIDLAPQGMTFNELTVSDNSVNINANFQVVSSLKIFVDSLKNYKPVKSVSITQIENRLSSAQIVVTITAELNKK